MAIGPTFVNGFETSWANITVKIGGQSITGLTGISYGDGIEESLETGMGTAHRPTRRSVGKYMPEEGTLTGFAADIQEIMQQAALLSVPPGNWAGSTFTIVVQYQRVTSGELRTHTLKECRILGVSESYSEGAELLKAELKFRPMEIDRDGMVGYSRLPSI